MLNDSWWVVVWWMRVKEEKEEKLLNRICVLLMISELLCIISTGCRSFPIVTHRVSLWLCIFNIKSIFYDDKMKYLTKNVELKRSGKKGNVSSTCHLIAWFCFQLHKKPLSTILTFSKTPNSSLTNKLPRTIWPECIDFIEASMSTYKSKSEMFQSLWPECWMGLQIQC